MARRLGATDAQLAALESGDTTSFDAGDAAALACADAMTRDAGRISHSMFATLGTQWNHAQTIEIIAVIGLFNYFNRLANALDVPPTR